MSQSREWWGVGIPEKREGDYEQVGSTHHPVSLVLTALTGSANQNSGQTFQAFLLCLYSLPLQAKFPLESKGPTLHCLPAPPGGSGQPSWPHLS